MAQTINRAAIDAATPDPELFLEVVFGRGVREAPDLFGDGREITSEEVLRLLNVFVEDRLSRITGRNHDAAQNQEQPVILWPEIDFHYNEKLIARPDLVLRSKTFVPRLAQYLVLLNVGGTSTYAWIETMLYANLTRFPSTFRNKDFDPEAICPLQFWSLSFLQESQAMNIWKLKHFPLQEWEDIRFEIRDVFGQDAKGTIDKFKRFATNPPSRQRDEHLLVQTLIIDLACRIHAGAILQEAIRVAGEAANAA